jgi:hypothetical protein
MGWERIAIRGSLRSSPLGHRPRVRHVSGTRLYTIFPGGVNKGASRGISGVNSPDMQGTCHGACHLLRESTPGTSIHTMFLGSFS